MKQTSLIIGNGFDLDLALPTGFSHFAKSDEWNELMGNISVDFWRREKYNSLLGELHTAAKNSSWFDVEEIIYNYTCINHKFQKESILEIKAEFNLLKDALKQYLKNVALPEEVNQSSISWTLLHALHETKKNIEIINFNYTNPFKLVGLIRNPKSSCITFVHGSLDEEIVLGCEIKDGMVNKQLSFLYKYNMLQKANHIALNMLESEEVIIFGHSINNMDFGYFRDFFKMASTCSTPKRDLIIITKDTECERDIKDNIRSQGISVTDLYNHLWTFDFVHTDGIYNGTKDDCEKWEAILNRHDFCK